MKLSKGKNKNNVKKSFRVLVELHNITQRCAFAKTHLLASCGMFFMRRDYPSLHQDANVCPGRGSTWSSMRSTRSPTRNDHTHTELCFSSLEKSLISVPLGKITAHYVCAEWVSRRRKRHITAKDAHFLFVALIMASSFWKETYLLEPSTKNLPRDVIVGSC